eukprot:CAMPEP_0202691902 /NCGR_PEP_ID=MMETSP1385-20130828/6465_1 /ASSEMBLY_ACC=CAM_ASM_000861 /TAXON_ID=933848 /ORGANISM="Elphidium margaritaceum" /LENGTH=353 /DNA_ID=CAMNT_0049347363 /DNA_START=24 /DNA_END=1085 /DNA_ORIENTATION=+
MTTDVEQNTRITKEIPFFDASPSVAFLQEIHLFEGCVNNEMAFKQLICHLMLTVCEHPYNASLILNLSIPLPMYRATMMDKFRKLDHILSIVIKPLPVTHKALSTRYKTCHYKDIVAHYTRYSFIAQSADSGDDDAGDDDDDDDVYISGRFVRKSVLGQNSNLDQFLCAIRDHLASDHSQFLTTSAAQLTTQDMDLLCSRYFCVCEALVSFAFGDEVVVDESRYYRDILQYLIAFVTYCLQIDSVQHPQFSGLNSDHLKLLIAGTVVLEIGLRKQRPIYRLQLDINKNSNKYLEQQLLQLTVTDDIKPYFALSKQIVDMTPGSKNVHFRKDIDQYFKEMYDVFKQYLMQKPTI